MSETFRITFLGTSAAIPTVRRNVSATLIVYQDLKWLVDCGEGTQRQILRANIGFKNLSRIVLSHEHLDHILGMGGLLATLNMLQPVDHVIVYGSSAVLERVRQDLAANPGLAGAGPAAVLPCVVDHAVAGDGPVLSALTDAVEDVTAAVFARAGSRPAERIYQLSRQVLEFRRATAPLAEMLDRLATHSPAPTGERLRQRFHEQRTHLLHLVEDAEGLGTLLSNVLQANQTEVSVRQNNDMRKISAWGAIWAIPTLLAGIYGMNFQHLPELGWRFGYPLVLAVMLAISLALYRAFRRSGWL